MSYNSTSKNDILIEYPEDAWGYVLLIISHIGSHNVPLFAQNHFDQVLQKSINTD